MADEKDTLELRYIGTRFNGGRIPLDVLPDLPAFRDLVIAVAKSLWLKEHPLRQRLPRGFNHSVSFDLIDIKDGSAGPQLQWNRQSAIQNAPDLANEIGYLIQSAYSEAANLFHGVSVGRFPIVLPAEQLAALNRFGSSLLPGEKIEFVDHADHNGNIVYLDVERRKQLLTKVSDTYSKRYAGSGILVTSSSDGYIEVSTTDFGKIRINVPSEIVITHFDGNMGSDVQFDLLLVLDSSDALRKVEHCLDVTIVDASDAQEFRDSMSRIADLRALEGGWLDGGGKAISQSAVQLARSVLHRRPDIARYGLGVFPTEEGGITFEFQKNGWEYAIEVLPAGGIEFYGVELVGTANVEPVGFGDASQALWAELDQRIGRFSKDG